MKQKRNLLIIVNISVILLITLILMYKSYGIYEGKNRINKTIQDQNSDSMLSFIEIDESGNQKILDKMPEGKKWTIEVNCNNNIEANWNYKTWKLEMKSIQNNTKCKLTFHPYHPRLKTMG